MSNPIALFEDLRDMYLRYLDSPFDLRYPDLVAERRALLNVDGRLFRQPLIEPIPAYQSSNRTFQTIAQARLGNSWSQSQVTDLADFVSLELFPPNRLPYTHQEQVFAESAQSRRWNRRKLRARRWMFFRKSRCRQNIRCASCRTWCSHRISARARRRRRKNAASKWRKSLRHICSRAKCAMP